MKYKIATLFPINSGFHAGAFLVEQFKPFEAARPTSRLIVCLIVYDKPRPIHKSSPRVFVFFSQIDHRLGLFMRRMFESALITGQYAVFCNHSHEKQEEDEKEVKDVKNAQNACHGVASHAKV